MFINLIYKGKFKMRTRKNKSEGQVSEIKDWPLL